MTEPHHYSGNEIELTNGWPFDVDVPNPSVIDLDTIASSLANLCRFGGHVQFYSVAEHAVLVAEKLGRIGAPVAIQLAGLHHDDHEALDGFGDIQRPAKPLLDSPEYRSRCSRIEHAVWLSLAWHPDGFTADALWSVSDLHSELVKRVDIWAVLFEARWLMKSRGDGWEQTVDRQLAAVPIPNHDEDGISCWTPTTARWAYLNLHKRLCRAAGR
jgi:hypothetical protein